MQWNLLADSLCGSEGSKGFERAPPESLPWEFRKNRILEHILELDPTILCVQELDEPHFDDWILPSLKSIGFDGVFEKKPNSVDGSAVFVNSERFSIASTKSIRYSASPSSDPPTVPTDLAPQNQKALIVQLLDKHSSRPLIVTVTHLKAEKNDLGESIRYQEMKTLLDSLLSDYGTTSTPIIIAADLNATPTSNHYPARVYPLIEQHSLGMRSSYANGRGADGEPEYTTWKVRKGQESRHTIDYIFYRVNCGLEVVSMLDMPVDVDDDRIPSFRYPSDHFSLLTEFEWC
ncbi:Nocturnin [Rhizoclosmatium hyalinum]|nr:Nocturnin [Rhizoclosmatium hyalinum]